MSALTAGARSLRKASTAAVLVVGLVGAGVAELGCKDNMLTGNLTPVPPVHRLPADVAGTVILIDRDPVIETKQPEHIARANEQNVPQNYRDAMTKAFVLGGFKVTSKPEERHDLVARLAINVTENGDDIRQVYRCGLFAPDGKTVVAQIDWAWPKGTYVDVFEVFDFATHNVATEVVTSRRVLAHLRKDRGSSDAPASSTMQ